MEIGMKEEGRSGKINRRGGCKIKGATWERRGLMGGGGERARGVSARGDEKNEEELGKCTPRKLV